MTRSRRPGPRSRAAIALMTAALLASCRIGTGLGEGEPEETFDIADRPVVIDVDDGSSDYRLLPPWNYDKPWNAARRYPLVVSLHGSGGSHYEPCIVNDDAEKQAHPCFFLSPTCANWDSAAAWVRDLIEELKEEYRIDPDRLYLMGFSMGGSGSYSFAKAYYAEHEGIFAGIVRLAGQSQTDLPDPLVRKTSVWYHIGLDDTTSDRVGVARAAYDFMKGHAYNMAARETSLSDTLSGYPRLTRTLSKGGVEIMKLSEYEGMGHDGGTAFNDPQVLDWLFSQDLGER